MTKKSRKQRRQDKAEKPALKANEEEREQDKEEDGHPLRVGVYSQQEMAFGDIMRTIFKSVSNAYKGEGMSRKQFRKASGVTKKTFKQIEGLDLNASLGDVLKVLAAANKTLAVVPLEDASQANHVLISIPVADDPQEEDN